MYVIKGSDSLNKPMNASMLCMYTFVHGLDKTMHVNGQMDSTVSAKSSRVLMSKLWLCKPAKVTQHSPEPCQFTVGWAV